MRIKCPHCNGKGFSEINSAVNMTCGWCMGQGELDLEIVPIESQNEAEIDKKWENTAWDTDVYLDDIDGKEPMTNDEWRRTCSAEEFAKWIYDLIMHEGNTEWYEDLLNYREDTMDYRADYHLIEMWLKEKHE
ncbi:MAG: hypothetical protein IKE94_12580 [Aeriscardovia sp.]|nr:hypothetical protein [Aeriscardovia sp.]